LGEDLVLWRHNDQIFAWQDLCPHRGARLSLGWVDQHELVSVLTKLRNVMA
jgi:nitrite reductase/ring-hydroxylating ferredoxin subunit